VALDWTTNHHTWARRQVRRPAGGSTEPLVREENVEFSCSRGLKMGGPSLGGGKRGKREEEVADDAS